MRIGLIVFDSPVNSAEVASLAVLLREAGVSIEQIDTIARVRSAAKVTDILAAVAAETGFLIGELVGERRHNAVSVARFAVSWVAARAAGASTTTIGQVLGNRDHTTIIHQLRRATDLRQTDADFRALTDRLLQRFTGSIQ
ncbi:helix-turn-helix domain-containing protein [Sphingomonas sp. AOB5]|uniref:helix-turn-helix domain-containing protein n=1 Tax=Sphingomonas sp. AOB5 TaxID=3034017 RepID=UPI0023F9F855|nr:helix-turn-helix domain-containing protein [Sphingomonas sp. AOB5]MDF7776897.1 helix-turn-helix domain-containing protein [Sphingomonas sp. AOB5]